MSERKYHTYINASKAANKLGIKTREEYTVRYKEDPLLPSVPERIYKSEWSGTKDFLGTKRNIYVSYDEARESALLLGVKTRAEYEKRYREDIRLPARPDALYKSEWKGYRKFLLNIYKSYKEASESAINLGIKSWNEYRFRYKEDPKLPAKPERRYKEEWTGYPEFLGLSSKVNYSDYQKAKSAVMKLGIHSWQEYQRRYKEDPLLPASPSIFYHSDFEGFHVFLGKPKMYSYEEAKKVVRKLGIKKLSDYRDASRIDHRLYRNPKVSYGDEWVDYVEFFELKRSRFYSKYKYASKAAIKLGIKSYSSYRRKRKLDPFLPSNPNLIYADEWNGFNDFLCIDLKKPYESFHEAKSVVKSLGIKTSREYNQKKKLDPKLPSNPETVYRGDWRGFKHFLGTQKLWYKSYREASNAVQALSISNQTQYNKLYKEDSKLPSMPMRVYKKNWTGWNDFLGLDNKKNYETIELASEAAQNLKICSWSDYKNRYKEDALLPGCPHVVYKSKWKGLRSFLNLRPRVDFYETYDEAMIAARNLKINTSSEYQKRYKEDPRLPSQPNKKYCQEWMSMADFLLGEKKFYLTYIEASNATKKLRIISQTDYIIKYKKDPKLPSVPNVKYSKDWVSWDEFIYPKIVNDLDDLKHLCKCLGICDSKGYKNERKVNKLLPAKPDVFFEDWVDWYDLLDIPKPYDYLFLKQIVNSNDCSNMEEYKALRVRLKDPHIPSDPISHYKEWTNTYDFFGKARPYQVKYFTESWQLWAEKITDFLKIARGADSKIKDLCEFVREYIEPNNLGKCPLEFLTRKSTNIQPMLDLLEQVSVARKKKWIYSINEFLDWVILNYLIIEDEETGEVAHIKGAKNPLGHINFNGEPYTHSVSETDKLALPYQYVKEGREWIFPVYSIARQQSYSDLVHLHNFPADWVQVDDESLLDKKDPDCVFKVEEGKAYLWLPMFWTYTYSLMQLPARGMQIVYCDSGEADSEIADFKNNQIVWKRNKTKLAGLTSKQGMVSKSGKDEFGVHYTSNKTKFDGSGYTIPFMPIELAYWLIKLRKWQQKYNPIKEPTKWFDCERTNLNETQRKQKGINCFLFRDYEEKEPGTFSGRLTVRLAAALFFSSENDYTTATYRGLSYAKSIEELKNNTKIAVSNFKSPYTPHSMRVSLINAYAYEFGIPLEVIMKLVGHSSIIMSIYYIKSDKTGANLREKMESGEKEAISKATQTLKSFVEQQRIEEVKSQLVGSPADQLNSLNNTRPASSYLWKDFGICPVGGAFCSEGGSPIATKANIYHPVPAGYLGEQNCFKCRFFITGPAFLVGLTAMFNEMSLAVNSQSSRYSSLEEKLDHIAEKIDIIDHQLYKIKMDSSDKLALESNRHELVGERMHLNSEIETRAKKLDLYLSDMNAIHRHMHNCQTLMYQYQEDTTNHLQLIVPHEFTLGVELDEVSNFHQLSEVCSNAELYHSCSDDLAVARRSQMIDKMMVENGIQPQLFLLSEEEQLLVGNQLTELMLTRLKGWENVDRLMRGSLTLKDLSIENQFDEQTIRELFERSKPLKRIG
ncbi:MULTISPECIES: gamma-mobile-trio integrase GmtZ [Vibrio]|uniref:Integrase n=1 Tax=Vibrio lentus TaxID=136468 RepID=A0A855ILR5_9VIBR|nr:VPA1269 family protein [Vibrio lentus]PMM55460.1 integrase [Vibrio lentus]